MSNFKSNFKSTMTRVGKYVGNSAKSAVKPVVQFSQGVSAGMRGQYLNAGAPLNMSGAYHAGVNTGAEIRNLAAAGKNFVTKTLPKGLKWIGGKMAVFMGNVWKVIQKAGGYVFRFIRKFVTNASVRIKPVVQRAKAKVASVNTKIARALTSKPTTTTMTGRARSKKSMSRAMNRYENKVQKRAALLGRAEAIGAAYGVGRLIYSRLIGEMESED